jgi:ERCC4-type nuclease
MSMDRQTQNLPALRGLARLADLRPKIVVDTREQAPLVFTNLPSVRGTLQSGDYAPAGLEHVAAVERKSAVDLVASVTRERERFERELHRLRGFHFARVLVTASRDSIARGEYRSAASPKAVLASCEALEVRYRLPFVFVENDVEAARLVEGWFWHVARDVVMTANDLLRGCEMNVEDVGLN